ncbi:MAG: PDZ domain-containing protein [Planctomycetota bacterium]|nr:PDZ domain-containing protein [Planctomycetota bacterium]
MTRLTCFLITATLSASHADTILTRDGERFLGQPAAEDQSQFTLRTKYGDLKIPLDVIVSHKRDQYRVTLKDGSKVEGRIQSQNDKEVVVNGRKLARDTIDSVVIRATRAAMNPAEMGKLFQRSLDLHSKKKFAESVRILKRILTERPNHSTALYNIACALALTDKKDEALVYLKKSVETGFINFVHMEQDADLDSLRKEKGYLELLKNRDEYVQKFKELRLSGIATALKNQGVDADSYEWFSDEERNFIYLHNRSKEELAQIRKGLNDFAEVTWKTIFKNRPSLPLYIVLLSSADTRKMFKGGKGGFFNPATRTLFCGDIPSWRLAKTSIILHEFTHALHHADVNARGQAHPIWFIEGLGSLYETAELEEAILPKHSQRLAILQDAIKRKLSTPWAEFMKMSQPEYMRRPIISYAQARYMTFYLWEKGLLRTFYDDFAIKKNYDHDRTGREAYEVMFGKPVQAIERDWKAWVQSLKVPPVPFLGVGGKAEKGKLLINQVMRKSAAMQAGLKKGDALLSIDGEPTPNMEALMKLIGEMETDQEIEIRYSRAADEKTAKVKLGRRPAPRLPRPRPPEATAYLGIAVKKVKDGIEIQEITKGWPVEKLGIKAGDFIASIDGKEVSSVRAYLRHFRKVKPGKVVKLKIRSGDEEKELEVKTGRL